MAFHLDGYGFDITRQIVGKKCSVVLSSPHHDPIKKLNLALIEKMALGRFQFCGTFFEIGTGFRQLPISY
jgi:hypothetical protein